MSVARPDLILNSFACSQILKGLVRWVLRTRMRPLQLMHLGEGALPPRLLATIHGMSRAEAAH